MRTALLIVVTIGICLSCNNHADNPTVPAGAVTEEKQSFFPVTSYIRGQLFGFKERGINPIHYTITGDHTDSAWIKVEEVERLVKDFLEPEIDSVNLTGLFTETRFQDKSIDSYTFTYDPKGPLPDSMQLQHWDVYVDAKTGKVKKIYLLKKVSPSRDLQLTWQSDKWCSIVTIENTAGGNSSVAKEEKINWDF